MFFRRKGWLREEFDDRLLSQISDIRVDWANQKALVEKSFDPSEEILSHAKLTEAKYLYLIKEAKNRKINIRR